MQIQHCYREPKLFMWEPPFHCWCVLHQEIGESKTIAELPLSTIIIPKITSKMYQNDTLKDQIM